MAVLIDFTSEKYKRLIALAQARGEPVEPLVKRLVLEAIEQVQEGLERRRGRTSGPR